MIKNWVILVLLIYFTKPLVSQEPAFQILNQNNGLASNTVYDLLQDSKGYIWIAGEKGLSKFDGVNFTPFANKKQNTKTFSNIVEYKIGEVIVQNFSGQFFKTNKDSLIYEANLSKNTIYYPSIKIDNRMYNFSSKGILITDLITQKATFIKTKKYIFENAIAVDGSIIFQTEMNELVQFKDNIFKIIAKLKSKETELYKVVKCKKGFLFFLKSNNKRILFFDGEKTSEIKGIEENVFLNKICKFDSKIWICTTNGIYVYDENFNRVNKDVMLKDFNISTIIKDKTNAYWISTLDKGLLYIPTITNGKINDYAPSVFCKKEDNAILFGTFNNNGYEYKFKQNAFVPVFKVPYPNQVVACLYDAENKTSIYASNSIKFFKNNLLTTEIKIACKDIVKLWNNSYFIAHSNGTNIITNNNKKALFLPNWIKPNLKPNIYNLDNSIARTKAVEYYYPDSIFVIGNVKGLFLQNRKGKKEIKFKGNIILSNDLLIKNNLLYIASSIGLLIYDFKSGKINTIEVQADNINRVKINNNNLYFSSDYVLYKYHLLTKKLEQWFCANGLAKDEIKDFEVFDNQYIIGLNSGIINSVGNLFDLNKDKPQIFIDKITNSETLKVLNTEKLELNYNENNLDIYFSIPFYKNLNSLQIFYKINNGKWIKTPINQRIIALASLEPKTYLIQIKAITTSGIVSNIQSIEIVISPPMYKTWWFSLIILFSIIAFIVWLFKFRTNQLKKHQKEVLEKQELSRQLDLSALKTLRAQMNPHFIYNSLNSIQSYVYSGEKELASKYLGLFSDLSRSLLDSSNLQEISLFDELVLINLYLQLECVRLPKIKYSINKSTDLKEHEILIPAMIIQPIVENAIKHGLANKEDNCLLKINVKIENDMLCLEIDDNGIGRKKAEELNKAKRYKPTSFSTEAIESRIYLLNKNRESQIAHVVLDKFEGEKAAGTLVKLTIPLDYND